MARLEEEEEVELKKNEALAQRKIIKEFKSSEDYQEEVENAASKYFGEGFDFCKRQLAHHHPNLIIDLDDMDMDRDLLEKEGDESEEKEEDNQKGEEQEKVEKKRDTNPLSP